MLPLVEAYSYQEKSSTILQLNWWSHRMDLMISQGVAGSLEEANCINSNNRQPCY